MIRLVYAQGDPAARGRSLGRALRGEIEASLAFYRGLLAERRVAPGELTCLLAPYRAAAEAALPALVAQLDAAAEAAGVPADELLAVNAWEELDPLLAAEEVAAARCTTFTAVAPGTTILAHSEHWFAADAGSVALIVERPGDGSPTLVSPTIAACLPAVGMNAHRVAQGIDSLSARDDGAGIPRVLVSRHALEANGRSDAVARAGLAGRAGGYGHVFALPGGEAFAVETTARRLAVLEGPGGHTNHYLDPELAELGPEPGESSLARHSRLTELLAERAPQTPEDAMTILRDEGVGPRSAGYATVFSLVCEVESGRMWLADGDPRERPFEEVELADVV